ncbi:MerR family transcriptional regulator [Leisingera sp.]|uniref:MerR family transcriptional regulator n=1 Tax=Leisingera sp. TaxID=1879318 RepID=UPI003A8CC2DE
MSKSPDAFRTISEVAEWLGVQAHVLRFWESKFTQVKPVKRAGGRRYYRPADMLLLGGIRKLLHDDGLSIKDVQTLLRDRGVSHVAALSQPLDGEDSPQDDSPRTPADPQPAADTLGSDWQESMQLAQEAQPTPAATSDNVLGFPAAAAKTAPLPTSDPATPAPAPEEAAPAPQMQMDFPASTQEAPAPEAPPHHAESETEFETEAEPQGETAAVSDSESLQPLAEDARPTFEDPASPAADSAPESVGPDTLVLSEPPQIETEMADPQPDDALLAAADLVPDMPLDFGDDATALPPESTAAEAQAPAQEPETEDTDSALFPPQDLDEASRQVQPLDFAAGFEEEPEPADLPTVAPAAPVSAPTAGAAASARPVELPQLDAEQPSTEDSPQPAPAAAPQSVVPGVLTHLAQLEQLPPHLTAEIAECAQALRVWIDGR